MRRHSLLQRARFRYGYVRKCAQIAVWVAPRSGSNNHQTVSVHVNERSVIFCLGDVLDALGCSGIYTWQAKVWCSVTRARFGSSKPLTPHHTPNTRSALNKRGGGGHPRKNVHYRAGYPRFHRGEVGACAVKDLPNLPMPRVLCLA